MLPTIHDAIRAIHSNVVTIVGDDINYLIAYDQNNNVIEVDKASATARLPSLQSEYEAQQQAQAQNKQNALAKLAALGLTADEISALGR
jgi:hypothetical protein